MFPGLCRSRWCLNCHFLTFGLWVIVEHVKSSIFATPPTNFVKLLWKLAQVIFRPRRAEMTGQIFRAIFWDVPLQSWLCRWRCLFLVLNLTACNELCLTMQNDILVFIVTSHICFFSTLYFCYFWSTVLFHALMGLAYIDAWISEGCPLHPRCTMSTEWCNLLKHTPRVHKVADLNLEWSVSGLYIWSVH